jgi:outer membrane protein assembly factor BamB
MARLSLALLLGAALAGATLFSCGSSAPSREIPVPEDLPRAREGLPPGMTIWTRRVLAGTDRLHLRRGWLTGGLVVLETSAPSLIVLDAETGAERFGLLLKSPLTQAPHSDGRILAALTRGRLQVADARTGRLLVSQHLYFVPAAAPCCREDTVYLTAFSEKRIQAIDGRTGRNGWFWEGPQVPVGGVDLCQGARGREILVCPMERGEVMGFRAYAAQAPNPSDPAWRVTRMGRGQGWVRARADIAYVATADALVYAVKGNSGALVWSRPTNDACRRRPDLGRRELFVQAGSRYLCLDLAGGGLRWSFPGHLRMVRAGEKHLWAATSDDQLLRIDLADGRVTGAWRTRDLGWLDNQAGDLLIGWSRTGEVLARR